MHKVELFEQMEEKERKYLKLRDARSNGEPVDPLELLQALSEFTIAFNKYYDDANTNTTEREE